MKQVFSRLLDALSIHFIRVIPFILMTIVLCWYIGLYYSFINGNYTEFYDENGLLCSLDYESPVADWAMTVFAYSPATLIPIMILSFRMRYCIYHQLGIYYLFINSFVVDYFSSRLTTENTLQYISGALIFLGISIVLIVVAYLKYGDRKVPKSVHSK